MEVQVNDLLTRTACRACSPDLLCVDVHAAEGLGSLLSENARGLVLLQSTCRSAFRPVKDLCRPFGGFRQVTTCPGPGLKGVQNTETSANEQVLPETSALLKVERASDGQERKLRTAFRDSGW